MVPDEARCGRRWAWRASLPLWLAVAAMSSRPAAAEEFIPVGPRAAGMGGAGVAATRGSLSTYWNPAALAPPRMPAARPFFDFALTAGGVGAVSGDVLRDIDDVAEIVEGLDFDSLEARLAAGGSLTPEEVAALVELAEELPDLERDGTGVLAELYAMLGLRFGRFGASALGLFHGGGVTQLDRMRLALGTMGVDPLFPGSGAAPSTAAGRDFRDFLLTLGVLDQDQADELAALAEETDVDLADPDFRQIVADILRATDANEGGTAEQLITANRSGVELRGILVQEYALGYAQPLSDFFDIAPLDWLSVGATLKLMAGTTYFNSFELRTLDEFSDVVSDVYEAGEEETSFSLGVDVGLLAQPLDWLSVGLVARNVNRPRFDFAGPGQYQLDPQVRAGLAVADVLSGWTFAADIDLTRNQTDALPGFRSQSIGGGVEYSVMDWDVLFLRAGVSKNLAESDEGVVLHAGLGLRLGWVSLDAAIMASPELTEIETDRNGGTEELPERGGLAFMLGVNVPFE